MAAAALGLPWTASVMLVALIFAVFYVRGWGRARSIVPSLATPARLMLFVLGTLWIVAALAGPLAVWSQTSYLARMGQKVAICLIGAPLWWLGLPLHLAAMGTPAGVRRLIAAWFVRPNRLTPTLQAISAPVTAWFLYLSAFLLWHDPTLADWSMAAPWRQRWMLVMLLVPALLFWQQITRCGWRRYTRAGLPTRFVMLVGVEVPNVIAGISIAFRTTPMYQHYAQIAQRGDTLGALGLTQQALGGALTWIFGSLVYITSIVLVVNQVFRREGGDRPQAPAGWDAEEKFIAPGLEDRLTELGWQPHDWRR